MFSKSSKVMKKAAATVLVFATAFTTVFASAPATSEAAAKNSIKGKKTILVGQSVNVTVGNAKKSSTYKWITKNAKVFSATQNAKKPGKAAIKGIKEGKVSLVCYYTAGGKGKRTRLSTKVTVVKPVNKVKISGKKKVEAGKTIKLKATYTPRSKYMKVKWSTSKKSVAKVSSKGVVTGVKAGTAKITATSLNGKKATVKVKVTKATSNLIYELATEKGVNEDNGEKWGPVTSFGGKKCVQSLYKKYKYNWGAIWLCRAVFYDGDKIDYRGKKMRITGYYQFTGKDKLKEVCASFNFTQPESYPIVKKDSNVAPNVWHKVDFTYTIPKNAINGDKDDETGKNFPIMFYYAWKTENGDFSAGDDFYFADYKFELVD